MISCNVSRLAKMLKSSYDVKMGTYTFFRLNEAGYFSDLIVTAVHNKGNFLAFPFLLIYLMSKKKVWGFEKKYLVTKTQYCNIAVSNNEWENMSSLVVLSIVALYSAQSSTVSANRKRWPLEDQT
jgi:hypothetical protein